MHSIEILGEPSRIPGIEEIDWFLMEYLSDYGIDLTIEHRDLSKEGVYGWCMSLHGNEFFIQIHNDLSDEDYTKTILHELYHVYQHLKIRYYMNELLHICTTKRCIVRLATFQYPKKRQVIG